jgi:hypothetical protein
MDQKRIFEPRRDKILREWRKLHNEELHNFYSLPSAIRIIRSRRMRGAGDVAHMGEEEYMEGFDWKARRKDTTRKTYT